MHVWHHNTGKAAKEFISLLQELDMCGHPIHRHCFTGNEPEFKQWAEMLPNCLFNIGPISLRKPSTVNAMRTFGLSKLMLEADAPYMHNHKRPWHVHAVAEHRSLTLICFLYLYTLYVVEGRTVTSLMHKLFLGELHRYYSGYNLVRIPFE